MRLFELRRFHSSWVLLASLGLSACSNSAKDTATSEDATDPSTGGAASTSGATDEATTRPAQTESGPVDPTTGGPSSDPSDPSTGDITGGFIQEPDGGLSGQCDPKLQDCPAGEKCTAVSSGPGEPWGLNKCVAKNGSDQVGDPCDIEDGKYTGIDNCDVGLICLLTDDEGKGGACVEFCDGSDQCPKTGAKCVVYNEGSLPICLTDCDPLIQDCPEGQACYNSAGDDFVCFKESAMPGEGAPGDECSYINQCQKGSFCANPAAVANCGAATGCCTPYCAVSEGNDVCQEGEVCSPFFVDGMEPPGLEDVGVCAIPE